MANRKITAEDIKRYLDYSKEIEGYESTLYESVDKLSQQEFMINHLVAEQNKIRFDENETDLFRDQLETVITILAHSFREFGFGYNLYFDLVYNLMLLEYETLDRLSNKDDVSYMLNDIGINDYIKDKARALLEHEGGCGKC